MAEQDTDRDGIVAAYADGTPIEDIERLYGVNRAEIEQIVAGELQAPPSPKPRAPGTVMAAVLLVAAAGLAAAVRLADTMDGWAFAVAALIGLFINGWIAYGLWLGQRGAQILAVIGGALSVLSGLNGAPLTLVTGAALVGLLLVPEPAREWFTRR